MLVSMLYRYWTDKKIFLKEFYKTGTGSSGRKRKKIRCVAGPAVSVKQDAAAGPFFVPKTGTTSSGCVSWI